MSNNKKSLWPIGILLVILLGVVLIIISVRISKMQSIDSNMPYNLKKIDMDKHANDILHNQNAFEREYSAYVGVNRKDVISKNYALQSPYYAKPVPRELPEPKDRMRGDDSVYLVLERRDDSKKNLDSAESSAPFSAKSMESSKIDSIKSSNNPNFEIESISLEAVRILENDKNLQKKVYQMELSSKENSQIIYAAHNITLPNKGYYEIDFKIKLKNNENIVVFSKWIFNDTESK